MRPGKRKATDPECALHKLLEAARLKASVRAKVGARVLGDQAAVRLR